MSLAAPTAAPRQVRDGVVDMAWIVDAYPRGSSPNEVFDFPVFIRDRAAVNMAMDHGRRRLPRTSRVSSARSACARGQAIHMAEFAGSLASGPRGQEIPHSVAHRDSVGGRALGESVKTSVGGNPVSRPKEGGRRRPDPDSKHPPLRSRADEPVSRGPAASVWAPRRSSVLNEDRWNGLRQTSARSSRTPRGETARQGRRHSETAPKPSASKMATDSRGTTRPAYRRGVGRVEPPSLTVVVAGFAEMGELGRSMDRHSRQDGPTGSKEHDVELPGQPSDDVA